VDPLSALIVAILITHVIMKAAAQSAADQARTEARRAGNAIRADLRGRRSAAARRLAARLDAGRKAGPVYPMWWAWAAVRGAGALRRGYRQRRRTAEAGRRPLNRPTGVFGRILGAAWRGGRYAWTEEIRRRREARERPRPAPAGPGPGPGPGAGPRGDGGPRPGRDRPRPLPVGVCEACGAVAVVTALALARTRHGRTARMCAGCRAAAEADRRADAASAASSGAAEDTAGPRDVVDADVVDDELADDPPGASGPAPALGPVVCVRCGEPLGASCCLNPGCLLCPANHGRLDEAGEWPEQFRMPVRYCPECSTQLLPGTWYAVSATNADVCLFCAQRNHPDGSCRPRQDAELAAIGTPLDSQGREITDPPRAGYELLGAEAARIALAAAGPAGPADPPDSPPDPPAGTQALPAPRAAPALPPPDKPTGDSDMSCNGELHTQADWGSHSGAVQDQLTTITDSSENMLRCLDARQAGREHMTLAAQWADQVRTCVSYGDDVITSVNTRQDPYVNAVQGAGGSDEVAEPGYYDEM
jgi:hypothetical protein